MAGIELKIDDDYINGMASLFETRSQDLQKGVDSYLTILAGIREEAIQEGDTAEALDAFIEYASSLKGIISELGKTAKDTCNNFLAEIDEKDQYLF